MGLFNVYGISSSAMNAETIRMNLSASNIANKNNISGSEEDAYRAQKPVFSIDDNGGVYVKNIVKSERQLNVIHDPNHPLADKNGNVFGTNVSDEEEMADVISASKSYEMNAEILNSIKQLMIKTIQM